METIRKSKASTAAKNRYNVKAYDRVNLILKKTESPTKDEVQAAADAAGESLNGFIVGAITQRMEKAPLHQQMQEESEAASNA